MLDAALRFAVANLALAIGVALVLVLRKPVRRAFGSTQAYALWLLPPLTMLASFLPPRIVERQVHFFAAPPAIEAPAAISAPSIQPDPALTVDAPREPVTVESRPASSSIEQPTKIKPTLPDFDPWMLALAGWIAGTLVMATWLASRQSRFMAAVKRGEAGPAVVGVLRPRIVMPSDFENRFDARERGVILAHEAIHLSRHDAQINAAAAFVRCLCWFNPMAHIGAHAMRIDQELACDAAVVERHPRERRLYADALLKTQLASHPLPLGCYWPARAEHPLVERIAMLKQEGPGAARRVVGVSVLVLIAAGASVAAWAAQPPEERIVQINDPAPAPQQQPRASSPQQQPAQQTPAPSPSATTPASDGYTRPMWSRTYPNRAFNLPAGFDDTDLIVLRGEVEKIDFRGASYVVFLRANSIAAGETPPANALYLRASNVAANETLPARADGHLWELPPVNYFGDSASADAIRKDMLKRRVMVAGYNAIDKSCKPTCRIFANAIDFPHQTALPPLSTTPEFGVNDFALNYDTRRVRIVHGKVQKLDFGARVFDAYVATSPHGARPGQVYQVRSEYLLPRADIEALLKGKEITVGGWPSRTAVDAPCDEACGLYGTDIQLPGVGRITPAGKKLVADASTSFPAPPRDDTAFPFVAPGLAELNALVDESEPLTLKGKLLRFEGDGLNTVMWVEVEDVQPATPGGKRGAQWRVLGGNPYIAPVGAEVTILGYNTNDKSCKPSCVMRGLSFSAANPGPAAPPTPAAPPAPQPTRFEPPALPPMPARPAPISADGFRTDILTVPAGYDANTQVFLKGRIEAIDFGLKSYVAKVRASSIAPTPYGLATANTRLWRLSPVNYFGDPKAREAIRKDLIGKDVSVFGNPGGASTCGADPCLFTRDLLMPRNYPGFYQPERAILRDITDDTAKVTITGKIIRSEAADPGAGREGALLIHAESVSPASIPGSDRVWRVAGLAPSVGIQPGAIVSVTGYNARDASCTPSCLMRAERATPIVPAGPAVQKIQFAPPTAPAPAPSAPGFPPGGYGFAAYFDANDPVLVKGVITKVEYVTPYTQIYIEGAAGDRGGNPQRTKVQIWRGNSGQPSNISEDMRARLVVGAEVTARGYAAKDKSCDPNCWMAIRDLIFADGAKLMIGGQHGAELVAPQPPAEQRADMPPKIARMTVRDAVFHKPGEPDFHAEQAILNGDGIKGKVNIRSDRIQNLPDNKSVTYSGHVEVEWDGQSATADEATIEFNSPLP